MKYIYILGIEFSCDETSISVLKNGRYVLSNIINSQIDIHKIYCWVVPEIASRKHIDNINYVFDEPMKKSKMSINDINCIAVIRLLNASLVQSLSITTSSIWHIKTTSSEIVSV